MQPYSAYKLANVLRNINLFSYYPGLAGKTCHSTFQPMKTIDQALFWLTPVIAVLVIINQFYRVQTYDLSTWQGGGFGMFSSVDTINSRFLKIYLQVGNETIPVKTKDNFDKLITIALAEPTQENLHLLAKNIYAANWIHSGSFKQDPNAKNHYRPVLEILPADRTLPGLEPRIMVDGIMLEMWKTRFDSNTNTITTYKHTEYDYPTDDRS